MSGFFISFKEQDEMSYIRRCWNVRSRKHPDVPCNRPALFGDYCSFHYKNPRRFAIVSSVSLASASDQSNIRGVLSRFIALARLRIGLRTFSAVGPAYYDTAIATNRTDVATLDAVELIPKPYRFSFVVLDGEGRGDGSPNRIVWLFDIRALLSDQTGRNPYTGEEFPARVRNLIESRTNWLSRRHYSLSFNVDSPTAAAIQTQSQTISQRFLELSQLLDSYGYLSSPSWFERLDTTQIRGLCRELNRLWDYRLDLSEGQRTTIFPPWSDPFVRSSGLAPNILTPHRPTAQLQLALFLLQFVRAAATKEDRGLAVVYTLMALTHVSYSARTAFPWLYQ